MLVIYCARFYNVRQRFRRMTFAKPAGQSPLSRAPVSVSTKERGACARHSLVLDHSLSSSRLPRSSVWSQVLCRQDPHESAGNLVQYRKRASGKMRATFRLRHPPWSHNSNCTRAGPRLRRCARTDLQYFVEIYKNDVTSLRFRLSFRPWKLYGGVFKVLLFIYLTVIPNVLFKWPHRYLNRKKKHPV